MFIELEEASKMPRGTYEAIHQVELVVDKVTKRLKKKS
jgi:hypothetical protein